MELGLNKNPVKNRSVHLRPPRWSLRNGQRLKTAGKLALEIPSTSGSPGGIFRKKQMVDDSNGQKNVF